MKLEILFTAFNLAVLPFWLLLILAPRWIWTDRIVHSIGLPLTITAWAIALQITAPQSQPDASMGSLQGVMSLIGGAHGTLSVWTMLMSWDLLAGAWLSRDARRLRIHHGWVVLSLIVTYLLGILGFALYLVIRLVSRRTLTMHERSETQQERQSIVAVTME